MGVSGETHKEQQEKLGRWIIDVVNNYEFYIVISMLPFGYLFGFHFPFIIQGLVVAVIYIGYKKLIVPYTRGGDKFFFQFLGALFLFCALMGNIKYDVSYREKPITDFVANVIRIGVEKIDEPLFR